MKRRAGKAELLFAAAVLAVAVGGFALAHAADTAHPDGHAVATIARDGAVIEAAHADAAAILEEDPNLELPAHRALAREVRIVYANDHVAQGG